MYIAHLDLEMRVFPIYATHIHGMRVLSETYTPVQIQMILQKYLKIKSTPQLQRNLTALGNFGFGHYPRLGSRLISRTSSLFNTKN